MHIEYLYYFRAFSQNMSISKTAARYYMTPQGVSRSIHQLEKDFGVKLTLYQNNAISLTPAGIELSKRLEGFLGEFERVKGSLAGYRLAEVNASSARNRKVVTISVTPCVSMYVSALFNIQKVGLFEFDIRLKETSIASIVPAMDESLDEDSFSIISIPTTEKYRGILREMCEKASLAYTPLFVSPLVVMVSEFSPLAQHAAITPEDARGHSVARYQDTVLGDALDDFILEGDVKTVTNATPVINERIIQDQAISFAPKLVESGDSFLPGTITTVPTEGFFGTEFGMLLTEPARMSPCVKKIVAYLRDRLETEAIQGRFAGTFKLC